MKTNVLHFVAIMNRGGQETFLMNVFRKIDRSVISFDFLCSIEESGDYDAEINSLGGKIHYVDYSKDQGKLKSLKNARRLFRWLKGHPEYRIFHVHTHHAFDALLSAAAAKAAGVQKVIIHSHNSSALHHLTAHRVSKHLLNIMPVERFACSQEAGRWLFGKKQFRVILNGIVAEHFVFQPEIRETVRQEMGWNGQKIIGHVGRFNDQKNHMFLIRIFQELHKLDPGTRLVLIGRGGNEDAVKQYVQQNGLGDWVAFLGIRDDVERLYQGMDLFLLPSKFEGLPVVLVEAQAAALPCLISDVISEEIDITDYIHRASLDLTAEEWAQRAKELLDDTSCRRNMQSQIALAGYDIVATAQELLQFYMKSEDA